MESVPPRRVFFWVSYVVGTINIAFGLLLGFVPRTRHSPHYGGDLIIWATCFLILFACYPLAKKIFDPACQEKEGVPGNVYVAFRFLATGELVFALFRVVVFFVYFVIAKS